MEGKSDIDPIIILSSPLQPCGESTGDVVDKVASSGARQHTRRGLLLGKMGYLGDRVLSSQHFQGQS